MTELEAVNYIIAQSGSAPVTALTAGLPDIDSALLRLDEASTYVQKRGWWYNTDLNVEIDITAGTFTIPLPANTMKILSTNYSFLIPRNGLGYDPYTQSTSFPDLEGESVFLDLVMKLDFEDLPDTAQDAVRFAAAREHILIFLEDHRKAQLMEDPYRESIVEMKKDDLEVKRRNMGNSPKFIRTRGGVRPYRTGRGVNPNVPGG